LLQCKAYTSQSQNMAQFNTTLSLYIPRVVDTWANVEAISSIFNQLDIGNISRIDFVQKQGGNGIIYYQAFIYLSEWYDTTSARNLQERIMNYAEDPENSAAARIVYDDPWFWLLFVNTNPVTEVERDLRQRLQIAEQSQRNAFQLIAHLDMQCQNNAYWASCALGHANSLQTNVDFLMTHLGLSIQQDATLPQSLPVPPPSPLLRTTNTPFGASHTHFHESEEFGNSMVYPEPLSWEHIAATPPFGLAAPDWEADDETIAECFGAWANDQIHEDDECGWNSSSKTSTSAHSAKYSSSASGDEMSEIDEDEGLMPFVHTQETQRPRALTEEKELENRRRQKCQSQCNLVNNVTPPPPSISNVCKPVHGTIRNDENGDAWRWNNNYSRWFLLYRANPIIDEDCCMGV
jgi:hypothetical protein